MNDIKFVDILQLDDELQEKVRQWRNAEDIRRGMLTQNIINEAEHKRWLEDVRNGNNKKVWVVFFDDLPVGAVYLSSINEKELTSEWGMYIGEAAYRGRGISKAILLHLLEIFFEEMKFKMLITKVLSNNTVAQKLYRKFSFREKARSPFKSGQEVVILEFSSQDWKDFKSSLKDIYKN